MCLIGFVLESCVEIDLGLVTFRALLGCVVLIMAFRAWCVGTYYVGFTVYSTCQ